MALLVLEFGGTHPAGELIGDRVLDTVIGAAAGLLAAMLVTNRRPAGAWRRRWPPPTWPAPTPYTRWPPRRPRPPRSTPPAAG